MTTTNTRYVDPNAAAGGTGTTNALSGANCAYVSLAVWEAARQADLTSSDVIERCVCSSDDAGSTHAADTTVFDIDGWTTDATRYIQIEAASSHGGKWNAGIYRLAYGSNDNAFWVHEAYVRFSGIQFTKTTMSTGNNLILIYVNTTTSDVRMDKCIVWCPSYYVDRGILIGQDVTMRITNSLFNVLDYSGGSGRCAIRVGGSNTSCSIYNNTFVDSYYGVRRDAGTAYVKNNLFYNCTMPTLSLTGSANVDYNATEDADLGYTEQAGDRVSQTFTFVNAAGGDYHLAAADAGARNYGADLSATFTDDIDGETRPTGAGTWDIGCDEYVAAAGNPFYYYAQL